MEFLDLWHSGNVRNQSDHQEEYCLRDWAARRLDAREQGDDDARVRALDDFSRRRFKKRPRARQVGTEFWRRHADLNCCYSDSDAFHHG